MPTGPPPGGAWNTGAPTGPPPGAAVAPTGPAKATNQRTTAIILGALAAIVALVIGIVFVTRDSGTKQHAVSSTTRPSTTVTGTTLPAATTSSYPAGTIDPTNLKEGEVLLEPVNAPMAEPFTPTIGQGSEVTPTVPLPSIPLPTTTAPMPVGQVAVPTVAGNQPGLYGGTRNAAACDPQAMISFLEANPDKAAAWASVQGIAVGDIRAYIEDLTPVVLTRDTRVTNHGFRNGRAYAHQSVLQAGHAVLVDKYGVPRAKCSCGNPLSPPVPQSKPPVYVGPQWPTFNPTIIIVVVAVDPVIDGFTLVDVTTGDLIVRPIGADPGTPDLGTGDVRVTLRWGDTADLDLSVTDPSGETVSYGNPSVSSGGTLDVDANAPCDAATATPVENIIWPDTAPDGRYVIMVNLYNQCGAGDSHAFQLTAFIGGVQVAVAQGADDGTLIPSDGNGVVSSAVPSIVFVIDRGGSVIVPTNPTDEPVATTHTDAYEQAALNILDTVLTACGYTPSYTSLGEVDGPAWEFIASLPEGDADFLIYNPLGEYSIVPNNQLAIDVSVNCGFQEA